MPAFTFLLRAPIETAAAASLLCFCCNAAVSAGFTCAQGCGDLRLAVPLSPGAFVGANVGAVVDRRFPSPGLKLLFGVVCMFVSLRFILLFLRA